MKFFLILALLFGSALAHANDADEVLIEEIQALENEIVLIQDELRVQKEELASLRTARDSLTYKRFPEVAATIATAGAYLTLVRPEKTQRQKIKNQIYYRVHSGLYEVGRSRSNQEAQTRIDAYKDVFKQLEVEDRNALKNYLPRRIMVGAAPVIVWGASKIIQQYFMDHTRAMTEEERHDLMDLIADQIHLLDLKKEELRFLRNSKGSKS